MSHYQVVTGTSEYDLQNKVNDAINEGYRPVGSVSCTMVNTDPGFFGMNDIEEKWAQGMIKE